MFCETATQCPFVLWREHTSKGPSRFRSELALRMTSALPRPFDRSQVGMFLEMFHTLCQPLLWQLACASPSSLESYFAPIRNDTSNCIPCLRCILGSKLNMFHPSTSIVVARKQEVVSPHVPRGCLLLPHSCSLHPRTLGKRRVDLAQQTAWQELQDAPVCFLRS